MSIHNIPQAAMTVRGLGAFVSISNMGGVPFPAR